MYKIHTSGDNKEYHDNDDVEMILRLFHQIQGEDDDSHDFENDFDAREQDPTGADFAVFQSQ